MTSKLFLPQTLVLFVGLLLSYSKVFAEGMEGYYVIVGANYAELEVNSVDDDESGYRIGLGHEIHRQWYLEVGVSQLASNYKSVPLPTSVQGAQAYHSGIDTTSIYASLLGKARGEMGELFYRLSVMNLSVKNDSVKAGEVSCDVGHASGFTLATGERYTRCAANDNTVAVGIGLGFDFQLSKNTQVRVEYEYMRAQDNIQLNTASVGFRYNF